MRFKKLVPITNSGTRPTSHRVGCCQYLAQSMEKCRWPFLRPKFQSQNQQQTTRALLLNSTEKWKKRKLSQFSRIYTRLRPLALMDFLFLFIEITGTSLKRFDKNGKKRFWKTQGRRIHKLLISCPCSKRVECKYIQQVQVYFFV